MHQTSPTHLRHVRLCLLLLSVLCAGAAWLGLAPCNQPVSAHLQLTEAPRLGQPLPLDVLVNAWRPLPVHCHLPASLAAHCVITHRSSNRLSGLSLRGPLWRQRFLLMITSPHPLPPGTLTCGPLSLPIPSLTATLPEDLPDAPALPPPPPAASPFPYWLLVTVPLLGLIVAVLVRRHRRSAGYRLRHLPATLASLDQLPGLLAAHRPIINRSTHPDFFARLDDLRFSSIPPTSQQLSELLADVRNHLVSSR